LTKHHPLKEIRTLYFVGLWATIVFSLAAAPIASAEVFTASIVSAEAAMPMQHGSSIIELDDGSLLASWYAGSAEAARDSRILLRRSASGGTIWEPTQVAVSPHECAAESWFSNKALGNTVLFQDKENIVWLFYAAVEFAGWSGAHVDYKISRDRGRTWSESHRLTSGLGNLPRSKPVEFSPHEIFLPLSHSVLRKYPYGARLQITNGKLRRLNYLPLTDSSVSHPVFLAPERDRVLAYFRARGSGKLKSAFVDILKNRWGEIRALDLPNSDSTVDALRLDGGRVLLVYNHDDADRNPLSIAISDDGYSFRKLRDIENEAGQDFSYPSLVRARDGTFYLTYTWHYRSAIKCVHFDATWLGLNPVSLD
jgi:predicted neuraminidase